MTATDHFAESEALLKRAHDAEGMSHAPEIIAAAQVHATLDVADAIRGRTEGVVVDLGPAPEYLSIPWPPSEELIERVAGAIRDAAAEPGGHIFTHVARAVLAVLGEAS